MHNPTLIFYTAVALGNLGTIPKEPFYIDPEISIEISVKEIGAPSGTKTTHWAATKIGPIRPLLLGSSIGPLAGSGGIV